MSVYIPSSSSIPVPDPISNASISPAPMNLNKVATGKMESGAHEIKKLEPHDTSANKTYEISQNLLSKINKLDLK